jgi:5-deoxy-glucuronate isomerase
VRLHFPAGSLAAGADPVRARFTHTVLDVLALAPGERRTLSTLDTERIVLPLNGSAVVECDGVRFELAGRSSVFSRVTDFAYLPRDAAVRLSSVDGAELALPGAYCARRLTPRYGPAEQVAVEVRGAGPASRQVTNFASPDTWAHAEALSAVELLTPGGNWSSYPPHRHDADVLDAVACPVVNEELYYFRIAGPDGRTPSTRGFGTHATYTTDGEIDENVRVRDGDVFHVPRGFHGPCVAAPGYTMYYLNVLAGPSPQRSMAFCDDPAHAWVRASWPGTTVDPRVPMTSAEGPVL